MSGLFSGLLTALVGSPAAVTEAPTKSNFDALTNKLPVPEIREQLSAVFASQPLSAEEQEIEAAKKIEAEYLARFEECESKAIKEHESQKAGFFFSCQRFGQFLTVNIRRKANAENLSPWFQTQGFKPPTEVSFSINLAKVESVHMDAGNEPDRTGFIEYCNNRHEYGNWDSVSKPKINVHVESSTETLPSFRQLYDKIKADKSRAIHHCDCDFGHAVGYRTKNWVRSARDDRIVFEGANIVIYAPAGMGQAVYQKILEAKEA